MQILGSHTELYTHYCPSRGWQVRWTESGKLKRRSVPKGIDPEHYKQQLRIELHGGRIVSRGNRFDVLVEMYFSAELERMLADGEIRQKRKKYIESNLKKYIIPFFGAMQAPDISAREIGEFQLELKHTHDLSGQTIAPIVSLVFRIINLVYLKSKIANWTLPSKEHVQTMRHSKKREKVTPDRAETLAVFLALETVRDRLIYNFAAECGMRISEVLGLAWGDIDRDVVSVKRSVVDGKDNQTTKTHDSQRSIRISKSQRALLSEYKLSCETTDNDRYIFTTKHGRLLNSADVLKQVLYKAQRKAGTRKWGFHALRRFYINELAERQLMKEHIQKLAGHRLGSAVTDKYYRDVRSELVLGDAYVVEL